jgi:hypothetical protein
MKQTIRPAGCALLLAATLGTSSLPTVVQATDITIGTASRAGVYFQVGRAMCRLVNYNSADHGLRCEPLPTDGSIANLRDLRAGDLDLAIVQSDWQYHATQGTGPFQDSGGLVAVPAVDRLAAAVHVPLRGLQRAPRRARSTWRSRSSWPSLAYPALKRSPRDYASRSRTGCWRGVGAFCAAYIFLFYDELSTRARRADHPGLVVASSAWCCCWRRRGARSARR